MCFEAVRGAEQFKTRAATNTMFPFTRNVVGSMDYTPAAFVVSDRDTTDAHEVATFLVYESGWQHTADKPENYEARRRPCTRSTSCRPCGTRPGCSPAGRARRPCSPAAPATAGSSAASRRCAAKTFDAPLGFLGPGAARRHPARRAAGLMRESPT